jgi:maleate cis-trans isomerase
MQFLIEVNFRQGASKEDNRAAAQMLRERMEKPRAGIKVLNAVADLGAGRLFVLADYSEEATRDIRNFLEFRTLPAVERVSGTPVVDAKTALDTYLSM